MLLKTSIVDIRKFPKGLQQTEQPKKSSSPFLGMPFRAPSRRADAASGLPSPHRGRPAWELFPAALVCEIGSLSWEFETRLVEEC